MLTVVAWIFFVVYTLWLCMLVVIGLNALDAPSVRWSLYWAWMIASFVVWFLCGSYIFGFY